MLLAEKLHDHKGPLPATITSYVAAFLLDVHTHKLPYAVAAAQAAEGSGKAQRLAMNSQDATIQYDQSSTPAQQPETPSWLKSFAP